MERELKGWTEKERGSIVEMIERWTFKMTRVWQRHGNDGENN